MRNYPTMPETLRELYLRSTEIYGDAPMSGFTDGSQEYSFASFRRQCDSVSAMLSRHSVGAGDKVAIISENCPNWMVAFMSAAAFGRVIVPVLPDCSANEVGNILRHSGAAAVFTSRRQLHKIENPENFRAVVDIGDFSVLDGQGIADIPAKEAIPAPDDLAAILYTSGTSGNAKGVMLSHRNFCTNIKASPYVYQAGPKDTFLSILPMAHTYELSLGELYPMLSGTTVRYLKGAPTPSALQKAFATVHPTVICSVPLIIEKVYRKSVLPAIRKSPTLSWMERHTPALLYAVVGMKMRKTFGGRIKAFAIGGAKLDGEVEAFLHRAHFPYLIGYGMTECAPLICATPHGQRKRVGSTGTPVHGVQVRINRPDPATGMGEIVVKGPNVMMGYYKDPGRTAEAFTEDGWLRTKDLACVDSRGRFSIRGRLGNMILGASGENIYPEEIEMVINGLDSVEESLVKSENGRLVALVKLYDDALDWDIEDEKALEEKIAEFRQTILAKVNAAVSKASQISRVDLMRVPFEKTATRKIRRFLYC